MSDLYAELGVSRTASEDEIRSAYKSLARTHHPDRGGNTEKFQKIQEAHEVLTDADRRRMYDMTGSTRDAPEHPGGGGGGIPFNFMPGMGPFGFPGMPGVAFDMSGIFGNMFGGEQRRRQGGKGPNKHHDIGLKLSEFYNGHEIHITFAQGRKCVGCKGSGAETSESCGACKGSGIRMLTRQIGPGMIAQTRGACDVCSGEGKRILKPCRECHGKKLIEKEKRLQVRITPGMREGEQIVLGEECSDTLEHDVPGDVVLTLRRADKGIGDVDEYEWKDDDLWIRRTISYAESVLGFRMTFEDHPSGTKPVFVWRGGPLIHGAVLQLPEMGMRGKGGKLGNLYVQILITPPETKPWNAEDAAKLSSVFGTPSISMNDSSLRNFVVYSAESKLTYEK